MESFKSAPASSLFMLLCSCNGCDPSCSGKHPEASSEELSPQDMVSPFSEEDREIWREIQEQNGTTPEDVDTATKAYAREIGIDLDSNQ